MGTSDESAPCYWHMGEHCTCWVKGRACCVCGDTEDILYNLLRGTLRSPTWPPNFWNDDRRKPGFGA